MARKSFNPRSGGAFRSMEALKQAIENTHGFQSPIWWGVQVNPNWRIPLESHDSSFNPRSGGAFRSIGSVLRVVESRWRSFNPRSGGAFRSISNHRHQSAAFGAEFQSPIWWGVQVNNCNGGPMEGFRRWFQSPIWLGVQVNVTEGPPLVLGMMCVSIPDLVGRSGQYLDWHGGVRG
jgi:hypothetical protein